MKLLIWLSLFVTFPVVAIEPLHKDDLTSALAVKDQTVHLVFFDVWQDGYSDKGPVANSKNISALSKGGQNVIWIAPKFNITDQQIQDFLSSQSEIKKFIADENLSVMRQFKVRKTPTHILVKNGEILFKGSTEEVLHLNEKGEK
ncbi:hypothetical protein QWI17_02240 [Gilvimarinus sp. SDUM040013]|uniref:Uncharacterized protein n=1 Tax=Gilvimarinus gilvus TaxID=3058038 RepID=A0ABU4RZE9_9GAMM|nr:hypothetical protein [Gilvimarinus sp. SDUM040013]MDO3384651.1 hypothetical protein [Gilvimarinus sp. SDUM040013]MDX6850237.1 hypothetical protein [Gilvimarinus sp. SDUM040013]